jgi:hypothetical protein
MTLLEDRLRGDAPEETVLAVVKGWDPASKESGPGALGRLLGKAPPPPPLVAERELWLTALHCQVLEQGTPVSSLELTDITHIEVTDDPHAKSRHVLTIHTSTGAVTIAGELDELEAFANEIRHAGSIPGSPLPLVSSDGTIDLTGSSATVTE